jgi:hypothetical protein
LVWLDKKGGAEDRISKTVYMEQNDSIEYSSSSFKLKPGERKTVVGKVVKTSAGLAGIQIWCDGYYEFTDYLNAGFSGRLQPQTDENIFEVGGSYAVNQTTHRSRTISLSERARRTLS